MKTPLFYSLLFAALAAGFVIGQAIQKPCPEVPDTEIHELRELVHYWQKVAQDREDFLPR